MTVRSDAEASFADLSGTYRFSGLGELKACQLPNPLVDFTDIRVPCDVKIRHDGKGFKASYVAADGRSITKALNLEEDPAASWEEAVLTTRVAKEATGVRVLPGHARHYRGTRIFRATDGHLRFIGFFEEKGMMLLLVPVRDYYDYELVLKRLGD